MSDVERTYLAKNGQGGISALYMIERGPDWLNDRVLHSSGWAPTWAISRLVVVGPKVLSERLAAKAGLHMRVGVANA